MLTNTEATIVGVFISLVASAVDAVGLNLQRRDHVLNSAKPRHLQKPEYKRPTWFAGFLLYVCSQLFGSSAALYFLQPAVVACLGSAALIFNFLFASMLVHSVIHRIDVFGTLLIIGGSVIVAIFGTIPKHDVTLDRLLALYDRPFFIAYFTCLIALALLLLSYTFWLRRLVEDTDRRQKTFLKGLRTARLRKMFGFGFAVSGGTIASITVQLAETGVRLLVVTFGGDNQFYDATAWLIIIILVASAVVQVICMNSGLKICDSVTVVPVFFAFYSVLALVNQNVYYDLWGDYGALNYGLIIPAIFILTYGVYIITASHAVDVDPHSAVDDADENWNGDETTFRESSDVDIVIVKEDRSRNASNTSKPSDTENTSSASVVPSLKRMPSVQEFNNVK